MRDKDSEHLGRAEELAFGAASDNQQLAETAMALLHCQSNTDVYDVIGDLMLRLVPGSIVMLAEADPQLGSFTVRKIAGLDQSLLMKATDVLGFDILGTKGAISPSLRGQLLSGTLSKLDGGLADLAAGVLPRKVAQAAGRLFGICDVFVIGIADQQTTLANFQILTRTPRAVLPTHVIESFARHCFSALTGIQRMHDLAKTSERNALLVSSLVEGLALHEIILDDTGRPCDYRFLNVNPAFEDMTGLKAQDIVGRTVLEVLPRTEPSWIDRYGTVAMTGEATRFDAYVNDLGRHFEIVAYSPQPGQFACVMSDITGRKLDQAELLKTNSRLRNMVHDVAGAIGRIGELRDPYTQGHEMRVAELSKILAREMGLPGEEVAGVEMAALMHDIGKHGVPAEILSKPGKLSAGEITLIREHPGTGYEILKDITFPWPVADAVLQHHERMDGSGYPQGLHGDDICRAARIIAVADVIEAMAGNRPYHPALGTDVAVKEIAAHPEQYDPDVIAACLRLHEAGRVC